jgi:hypothetical protein
MPITRTSSGTIFRTDFPGMAVPAGFSTVVGGTGAVVYTAGACDIDSTGGNGACVYNNTALPADMKYVVRTKAQVNTAQNGNLIFNMIDAASTPVAIYDDGTWGSLREPFHDFYVGGTPYRLIVEYRNNTYFTPLATADIDVNYLFEFDSDGANLTCRVRDATTLAEIASGTKAYGSAEVRTVTDNLYALIGSPCSVGWQCADNTHSSFEGFLSHDVTVTGLGAGNAVRIYDGSGTVLAEAVEAGGMATLDCELVDWVGLSADIKVFADGTYAVLLDSLVNITDASGGDDYAYSGAPPIPTPDPWVFLKDDAMPCSTGRVRLSDGDIVNFADMLTGGSVVLRNLADEGGVSTGRFEKEDGTTINIADLLGG